MPPPYRSIEAYTPIPRPSPPPHTHTDKHVTQRRFLRCSLATRERSAGRKSCDVSPSHSLGDRGLEVCRVCQYITLNPVYGYNEAVSGINFQAHGGGAGFRQKSKKHQDIICSRNSATCTQSATFPEGFTYLTTVTPATELKREGGVGRGGCGPNGFLIVNTVLLSCLDS